MSTQLVNISRRQKSTPPPAVLRALMARGGTDGPIIVEPSVVRPLRRLRRAAERAARKAAR